MICSPLLAKQYFPRQRPLAFTDWFSAGHKKAKQSFLYQNLDLPLLPPPPPPPQQKIPESTPDSTAGTVWKFLSELRHFIIRD